MPEFFRLAICSNFLAKEVFYQEFQPFFQNMYWDYLATKTNGPVLTTSEMDALAWLADWRAGGEPYSMEILTKCGAPYCQCARFLAR